MICFLLYLCLEKPVLALIVIMATAVYQSALFCILGEQLNSEVIDSAQNGISFKMSK